MTRPQESASPEIVVLDDPAAVAREGARRFAAAAARAVAARSRAMIALSGGSTPARLYDVLAAHGDGGADAAPIDWTRIHVCFGDERCVPPDHPDSNYRMAREHLLDRVPIPAENVHRIEAERDPDDAAARYRSALTTAFAQPAEAPPRFDLVLLGLGTDGHTASLFPGTTALEEHTLPCVANAVPQLATTRVTLTFPVLNAAREVMFLVTGSEKAQAMARALDPATPVAACPARGVAPVTGRVTWLVDRAAAAALRAEG